MSKQLDYKNLPKGVETNFKILKEDKAEISAGSGAPSGGEPNDLYVDTANNRLYINVNGTWKYASLT